MFLAGGDTSRSAELGGAAATQGADGISWEHIRRPPARRVGRLPTVTPRSGHTMVTNGDTVFVFGGFNEGSCVEGPMLELDPIDFSWAEVTGPGPQPQPRCSPRRHTCAKSVNGAVNSVKGQISLTL